MRIFPIVLLLLGNAHPAISVIDQSIRSVDFEKHLLFWALPWKNLCINGQPLLKIVDIEFADLDGDNEEEAVVEAQTCAMSTSSYDVTGVYKLSKDGLRLLPMGAETFHLKIPEGYERAGSRSRLDVRNGVLVSWYPLHNIGKRGGDSLIVVLTYQWNGREFWPERNDIFPALEFFNQ